MSYTLDACSVFQYLGADVVDKVHAQAAEGGIVVSSWTDPLPQPSEAEVASIALTPAYQNWLVENGGDPIRTARKRGEIALTEGGEGDPVLREVIKRVVEEFNTSAATIQALIDAITNAATLSELKANAAAVPAPATHTVPILREELLVRVFGPKG